MVVPLVRIKNKVMIKLTKKYRLVADVNKKIIICSEFDLKSTTVTEQEYIFEFDNEDDMFDKINELSLIFPENI